MIEIDSQSMVVQTDSDISIAELERELKKSGYTLNYFPVPSDNILLADVLNERIPNLYGEYFGGIDDLCLQIRLAQSDGSLWENVNAPRSATGPSLKKMAIGSKEWLGIPVQATLRIYYQPTSVEVGLIRFESDRHENFFFQSMKKNRTTIPLWARLSRREVAPFFENLKDKERVLGMALWGETEIVQVHWEYLQQLAVQKRGTWYEIEAGKNQSEWISDIKHHAILRIQKEWNRPVSELKGREFLEKKMKVLA